MDKIIEELKAVIARAQQAISGANEAKANAAAIQSQYSTKIESLAAVAKKLDVREKEVRAREIKVGSIEDLEKRAQYLDNERNSHRTFAKKEKKEIAGLRKKVEEDAAQNRVRREKMDQERVDLDSEKSNYKTAIKEEFLAKVAANQ